MTRILPLLLMGLLLAGCAHKDLKAPCASVASLAQGTIPCDEPEPISAPDVPLAFAQM